MQGPPSEGQLRYLEQLGYVINDQGAPATRAQAAELIDSLKAVQPAQQGQADFRPQVSLATQEWPCQDLLPVEVPYYTV